jgi:hypothetical protein
VEEDGAAAGNGAAAGRFHSSTGCFPVFTGTPEDEGSTGGDGHISLIALAGAKEGFGAKPI